MDALVAHHPDAVETASDAARDARPRGTFTKTSRTGPDATLATSSKARRAPGLHAARGPWTTVRASWWTWRFSWGDRNGEIVTDEDHDTGCFTERPGLIEDTPGATPDRITARCCPMEWCSWR
jgi:hypothetical protein